MFEPLLQVLRGQFNPNFRAECCLSNLRAHPSGGRAPNAIKALIDIRTQPGNEESIITLRNARESLEAALESKFETVRAGAALLLLGVPNPTPFTHVAKLFLSEQKVLVLQSYAALLSDGIARGYTECLNTLKWVTRNESVPWGKDPQKSRFQLACTLQLEALFGARIMNDYGEHLLREDRNPTFDDFIQFLRAQHKGNLSYLVDEPAVVQLLKSVEHFGLGPEETETQIIAGEIRRNLGEAPYQCRS